MSERGSIAPFLAGMLALILSSALMALGSLSVLVTSQRLQGVVDSAVLYAHDWSQNRGLPNQNQLAIYAQKFVSTAKSAKQLGITSLDSWVEDDYSVLRLCAVWQNPVAELTSTTKQVCRSAKAKSFLAF